MLIGVSWLVVMAAACAVLVVIDVVLARRVAKQAEHMAWQTGELVEKEVVVRLSSVLREEIEQLKAQVANETRRRIETVEAIALMEKQRNDWKELFHRAGAGHGAAQAMLMREITRLSRVAKCNGAKNAEISQACKRVVEQYEQEILTQLPPEKTSGISTGNPAESR